jgi:hypothetical protein
LRHRKEDFVFETRLAYRRSYFKKGQVKWLKSVILATWEVEIGRIKIGGQPGKKYETPSQLMAECSGVHLSFNYSRKYK